MPNLPGPIEEAWQKAQQEYGDNSPPPDPGVNTDEEDVQLESEQATSTPPPPPEEDWRKRFVEYKRSTDNTIHDLRALLASRDADRASQTYEIEQLRKQVAELSANVKKSYLPEGVLSQEDLEILGEENAQRIAKLAAAQAERIRQEQEGKILALTRKVKEREDIELQTRVKQQHQSFWDSVKRIVPDAAEIDVDERFSDFLNTVDDASGKTWRELGQAAKQIGDVGRMASIYKRFAEINKPKSREDDVVPRAASGSNTPPSTVNSSKIWTRAEYEKAVMDTIRGGPPTPQKIKAVDKLHAAFLQALREGRVR